MSTPAHPPLTVAKIAVRALLQNAARSAWTNNRPAQPGEAPGELDFLHELFDVAIKNLDSALGPALAAFGWSSETRGTFIDKRSIVVFDAARSSGGCEIGDLLIVIHNVSDARPAGNALLLQAKIKHFPISFTEGSDEWAQWQLYHEWPDFWWRNPFAYKRLDGDNRRHVRPAKPHPGAQYLSIAPKVPDSAEFLVAPTATEGRAGTDKLETDFADAIVDMVRRACGRQFCEQATADGRIGWDRVIWDLLESWTYSSNRLRKDRYSGFTAYRVGPTPPALLLEIADRATNELWGALPYLTSRFDEQPPEDARSKSAMLDEPALISTIFIAVDSG